MKKCRVLCVFISMLIACSNITLAQKAEAVAHSEEVVAYVNFGTEVESVGMKAFMGEKPDISVVNKIGREGWALDPKNMQDNAYIYFNVDDSIVKDLKDGSSYRVEVDYFDEGIASLVLAYDQIQHTKMINKINLSDTGGQKTVAPRELEFVEFTGTNKWKTYSWFLEDPAMYNRMGNGADFRVGVYGSSMGYSRGNEAVVVSAVRLIKTNTKSLLDIKINSDNLGNNFFEGERIKFDVTFDNTVYFYQSNTIGEYDADITYTVYDSNGNVCATKTDNVAIKPSKIVTKEVTFDIGRFDLYSIVVEVKNEKVALYSKEKSVFSYVKYAGDKQNSRLGIGTSAILYDSPHNIELSRLIKNAGFGLNRVHNSLFGEVHNSVRDKYDITNMTWYRQTSADTMKAFVKDNQKLLAYNQYEGDLLHYGPNGEKLPLTETGKETYTQITKELLNMYGDSCREIEIWNEWNGFGVASKEKGKDYAALCKYVYPRIKEEYPDVTVVGMVPSNMTEGKDGAEFFEDALKEGAADYMDVISIHIYQWFGSPITYKKQEELVHTHELLKKYDIEDKKVWITETGYSSNYENINTEEQQGWYNAQSYIMFQEDNLAERVYIYSAIDSNNRIRTDRESNFGMLEGMPPVDDGEVFASAKPAYLGYANLNALLYDAEYVNRIDFNENSRGYQFKRTNNGKDVLALFSNLAQDQATVDLGTDKVTVYDFYGNKYEQVSDDNKFTFNIDDAVLYVEGNFRRCIQCNDGMVKTDKAYIESDFSEIQTIRIENNTNKNLIAEIEVLDNSSIDCEESINVPTGGAELELKIGNTALKKQEPVCITVRDDENIYFSGDIIIDMVQKVFVDANIKMSDDGKWQITASVSNMSDTEESGTVEIVKPIEVSKQNRAEVRISSHEVAETAFVLEEEYTKEDLPLQIRYISDKEGSTPIYLDKVFNFEYMSRATTKPVIDGDLSEWNSGWIHMDKNFKTYIGGFTTYNGKNDLSANTAMMWDDENFYMAVEVTDDIHFAQDETPVNVWKLDSIQVGMVLYPEDMMLVGDFEEFALCYLDGKPVIYRHKTKMKTDNPSVIENAEIKVKQVNNKLYYEFKAPWKSLIPNFKGIAPGENIYTSIVINDNDGLGRKGVMLYGAGVEDVKDYTKFKKVYISNK